MAEQYFRHTFHTRTDPKILDLREKQGIEGYGIYWCLIECLFEQDGILSAKKIPALAYDWHVKSEQITDVLNNYELFEFDNENYFCSWIIESLKQKNEKIKILTANGAKGGKAKARKNKQMPSSDLANANNLDSKCQANAKQMPSSDLANQFNKTRQDNNKNKKLNNFVSSNKLTNNKRLDSSLEALEILNEKLDNVYKLASDHIDGYSYNRLHDLFEKISYEESITVGNVTIPTDKALWDLLDIFRRKETEAADLIVDCFYLIDSNMEIVNTFKYSISVFYNKAKGI